MTPEDDAISSYEILFSEPAEAELEAEYLRLARVRFELAERWNESILTACQSLSQLPKRYPLAPDQVQGGYQTRRMPFRIGASGYSFSTLSSSQQKTRQRLFAFFTYAAIYKRTPRNEFRRSDKPPSKRRETSTCFSSCVAATALAALATRRADLEGTVFSQPRNSFRGFLLRL